MAMNNWLGFTLSSQELSPNLHSSLYAADQVSIFEALNHPTNDQHHDWSMKSSEQYKGSSSEDSMRIGSNNRQYGTDDYDQPKLEDFLGSHSFTDQHLYDHHHYMNTDHGTTTSSTSPPAGNTSNSIGLSMIKNWLRNQPAPPAQRHQKSSQDIVGGCSNIGGHGDDKNDDIYTLSGLKGSLLSMRTESNSCVNSRLVNAAGSTGGAENGECFLSNNGDGNKLKDGDQSGVIEGAVQIRKPVDTFGQRTSIYRGVTRHRWTGRYEAHLWDNSCRREGQTRKGRQVYLGGYDKEDKAARAYDLAALKYWGITTTTNFPINNYKKELVEMKQMTRQEYIASLRRKSSGFSRGASMYRGVTRHHQHGRWQARIGRVAGNKDLYLGTFSTQEEAAEAYDIAAIKFRGLNAVTNFDMNRYDVEAVLESSTLSIGGNSAKRLKEASDTAHHTTTDTIQRNIDNATPQFTDHTTNTSDPVQIWPAIAFLQAHPLSTQFPYAQQICLPKIDQVSAMASMCHNVQEFHPLYMMDNTNSFTQSSVLVQNMSSSSMDHFSGSDYHQLNGSRHVMMPVISAVAVDEQGQNNEASSSYNMMVCSDHNQHTNSGYNNWVMADVAASASSGNAGTDLFMHTDDDAN